MGRSESRRVVRPASDDLDSIWIMGIGDPALIRRYVEQIPALQAVFPDYGRRVRRYEDAFYPLARGVPIFHAATRWEEHATHEQKVARLVDEIRQMTPAGRPAFLHAFIWNWGTDLSVLPEVMERLGPDYLAVRHDHLATLARQYFGRKKLLLRGSGAVTGIEGRPATFEVNLDHPTAGQIAFKAAVAGLSDGRVEPAKGTIEGYGGRVLTILGGPAGKTCTVTVEGDFGQRAVELPLTTIPKSELTGSLPGGVLRFAASYVATELPHRSGQAEPDPDALAGRAWVARAGQTAPGHIVSGPYQPLPSGCYLAFFRLKRIGNGDGPLIRLDAYVGGAHDDLGSVEPKVADLPTGRYLSVPLVFEHPGGTIETRVWWPGKVSVAVDSILLWVLP
jgi:hypothetical protein